MRQRGKGGAKSFRVECRRRGTVVGRSAFCAFRLKFAPRASRINFIQTSLPSHHTRSRSLGSMFHHPLTHSLTHSLRPTAFSFLILVTSFLPSFHPSDLLGRAGRPLCVPFCPYTTHKHSLPMQYSPSRRRSKGRRHPRFASASLCVHLLHRCRHSHKIL